MPLQTATPARIRRSIREAEYARTSNPAVLVARPGASDGFAQPREGFFDATADAQVLLDELAAQLTSNRVREAIETDTPFSLGQSLPLTPTIPRARAIDQSTGFDRTMFIKGVSIDLGSSRNSIEVIG
jgi:hypothetical protein